MAFTVLLIASAMLTELHIALTLNHVSEIVSLVVVMICFLHKFSPFSFLVVFFLSDMYCNFQKFFLNVWKVETAMRTVNKIKTSELNVSPGFKLGI